MSTDHPQVKTLDAELQPRLIDAQNRKYPGIDLSLLSVKERASEFTSQLLTMPEGGKWRGVVNTETRESSGDNLVDHAVAVEVFRQGGHGSSEGLFRMQNPCASSCGPDV